MMKKINVNLYGGKNIFGGRETPLEAEVLSCDCSDKCSLYKRGECFSATRLGGAYCKHAKKTCTTGYTSRAHKYSEFKNKWKNDECYNAIKVTNTKLALIDGEFAINLHLLKLNENGEIIDNVSFSSNPLIFLPQEQLTADVIERICSRDPRTIFDYRPIKQYQEDVAEFLHVLKGEFPEIYNDFIAKYPNRNKEINYVGKKALLSTIAVDVEVEYKSQQYPQFDAVYFWNGKTLKYLRGYASNPNIARIKTVISFEFEPEENTQITVTDNKQVLPTTKIIR